MKGGLVFRVLAPVGLLALGFVVAGALVSNRPEPKREVQPAKKERVEFVLMKSVSKPVRISAMGTVIPAKSAELRSEVSGRIAWQNVALVPGGRVEKGSALLRLDAREFRLAQKEKEAAVEKARFELKLEEGRQRVAEREWALMDQSGEASSAGRDLALRKPHLKSAQAALLAAESVLKRAELDLARSNLRSPFDALIVEESVDVGQLVSPQTTLATLVGTDQFWLRISVPVEDLSWIRLPDDQGKHGASAKVFQDLGAGHFQVKKGQVVRLLYDVDPRGRMARLLVAIDDPLNLRLPPSERGLPLLLGAYLRVEIEGRKLDAVFEVPRSALYGASRVWVIEEDDRLAPREVQIRRRGARSIFVGGGLKEGDRVVQSRLVAPTEGSSVRAVLFNSATHESKGTVSQRASDTPPPSREAPQ